MVERACGNAGATNALIVDHAARAFALGAQHAEASQRVEQRRLVGEVGARRVDVARHAVDDPLQRRGLPGRRARPRSTRAPGRRRSAGIRSRRRPSPALTCAARRPMPESPAKRKFSVSQTTLSCRRVGLIGAAHAMRAAGMPVTRGQPLDARRAQRRIGAQLGEHGAGLDGGELVLVAQQDDARGRRHGLDAACVASARSSIDASSTTRRSIGSGLSGVVAESPRVGQHAEQPVDGERLGGQPLAQRRRAGARRPCGSPPACARRPCRWARPGGSGSPDCRRGRRRAR